MLEINMFLGLIIGKILSVFLLTTPRGVEENKHIPDRIHCNLFKILSYKNLAKNNFFDRQLKYCTEILLLTVD
jgi:hypothetical protein